MNSEQEKRKDAEAVAQIMKTLPESEKQKLYGIAIGLQMAGQGKQETAS